MKFQSQYEDKASTLKRPRFHQVQKNGKSKQGNQYLKKFKLIKRDKKITIFVTNKKKSVDNGLTLRSP